MDMAAKVLSIIENPLGRLLKKHPLLMMVIMQIVSALVLIIIVSGIALAGCTVIWGFYKIFGMM